MLLNYFLYFRFSVAKCSLLVGFRLVDILVQSRGLLTVAIAAVLVVLVGGGPVVLFTADVSNSIS